MEFDLYLTPGNGGNTKIKQVLETNVPLSQQRIDCIGPQLVFDKKFTTFVPDRNDGVILNDDIVCYTDSSRIEQTGLARAGVYVQTDGEELVLPLVITPLSSGLKSLPC